MSKINRCFSCGCSTNKSNRSKEHIPPKMLTECLKYPPSKNVTVKACKSCNNLKSKEDQVHSHALLLTQPPEKLNMSMMFKTVEGNSKFRRFHESNSQMFPFSENMKEYASDIAKAVYFYDNDGVEPLCDNYNIESCTFGAYQDKQLSINRNRIKQTVQKDILEYEIVRTEKQIRFVLYFFDNILYLLTFDKNKNLPTH